MNAHEKRVIKAAVEWYEEMAGFWAPGSVTDVLEKAVANYLRATRKKVKRGRKK